MHPAKPFLFLFLFIFVVACRKDAPLESPPDSNEYYGDIYYSATSFMSRISKDSIHTFTAYSGSAYFYATPHQSSFEDVGTVSFGSILKGFNDGTSGVAGYGYQFTSAERLDTKNEPQFGSSTRFALSGKDNFGACSANMYVPQEIYLDAPPYRCCETYPMISDTNLPYTISWNKDAKNPGKLWIQLSYDGLSSNELDPKMDKQAHSEKSIDTEDDGMYQITQEDVSGFPKGSVITMNLTRYNGTVMQTNGKKIRIDTYATTSRSYLYK